MANLEGFDASQVDPKADFEPIPKSKQPGVIVGSVFEKTKDGNGEFLKLELELIDGPFRGRRLVDRLNLKNKNETAVKIAQATLSSICRAVNVLRPKDSAELHNRPMLIDIDLEERNDKPGSFSNRIRNYEALGNSNPVISGGGTQSQTQSSNTDASLPPWRRKSA
jgi:hypothetical protein